MVNVTTKNTGADMSAPTKILADFFLYLSIGKFPGANCTAEYDQQEIPCQPHQSINLYGHKKHYRYIVASSDYGAWRGNNCS